MGRFRTKLKGGNKGSRWPKGQSSNSNPNITKYRDLIRNSFFQESITNSNLTKEAVARHNSTETWKTFNGASEHMVEDDIKSTVWTDDSKVSFASEWSDCSNLTFSGFLKNFQPTSEIHKQMLAVLAAITEVIKQKGGVESSTEYYCALITTIDELYNRKDDVHTKQITASLALLSIGIKSVPQEVLKLNMKDVAWNLFQILNDYISEEHNIIIRSIFNILAVLLKSLDAVSLLENTENQKMVRQIMDPYCLHKRPAVRNYATSCITRIARNVKFLHLTTNPAAVLVIEHLYDILNKYLDEKRSSGKLEEVNVLRILAIMNEVLGEAPKAKMTQIAEILLKLMVLNYPSVVLCSLQTLSHWFINTRINLSATLNFQIIEALFNFQPASHNTQLSVAWLSAIEQAFAHLAKNNLPMVCSNLSPLFSTVTQFWLSDKTEVTESATRTLDFLLRNVVTLLCSTAESVKQYQQHLQKCFAHIEAGLSYQYSSLWSHVLYVTGVMFEVGGAYCFHLLGNCLRNLASLRDTHKFTNNAELEHVIGVSIQSFGPEAVLSIIPLQKPNGDLNLDRSWMIPLLNHNIRSCTLEYFKCGILPLANHCQKLSKELLLKGDAIGAHTNELLYIQLWNLLPSFCAKAVDISDSFKLLAQTLGVALSDCKELRLSVMASLRHLIKACVHCTSKQPTHLTEVARYDKNYLPILFNIYTSKTSGSYDEGIRAATYDTIESYLSIAQENIIVQLLDHAIDQLNNVDEIDDKLFTKKAILDLVKILVRYVTNEIHINRIYEECIQKILSDKSGKCHKKAYRILEAIISTDTKVCKAFILRQRKELQKLLRTENKFVFSATYGARLQCIALLLMAESEVVRDSKFIRFALPESVIACGELNKKTREVAAKILQLIGEIMMRHNQLDAFMVQIMAGLTTGKETIQANSIIAMTATLKHFSGRLGVSNLNNMLEAVVTMMRLPNRLVVGESLRFLDVFCVVLPKHTVEGYLEHIMKALIDLPKDCKGHFRVKTRFLVCRLIRNYGSDLLLPFASTDVVTTKRIRNLNKIIKRRQRKFKESLSSKSINSHNMNDRLSNDAVSVKKGSVSKGLIDDVLADSESEQETSDQTSFKTANLRAGTILLDNEPDNIIDFTVPTSVMKKLSLSKNGTKTSAAKDLNRGFKTASDGRIIIKDDNQDDGNSISSSNIVDKNLKYDSLLSKDKRKRKISTTSASVHGGKHARMGIHRYAKKSTSAVDEQNGVKMRKKTHRYRQSPLQPYAYYPLNKLAIKQRSNSWRNRNTDASKNSNG